MSENVFVPSVCFSAFYGACAERLIRTIADPMYMAFDSMRDRLVSTSKVRVFSPWKPFSDSVVWCEGTITDYLSGVVASEVRLTLFLGMVADPLKGCHLMDSMVRRTCSTRVRIVDGIRQVPVGRLDCDREGNLFEPELAAVQRYRAVNNLLAQLVYGFGYIPRRDRTLRCWRVAPIRKKHMVDS